MRDPIFNQPMFNKNPDDFFIYFLFLLFSFYFHCVCVFVVCFVVWLFFLGGGLWYNDNMSKQYQRYQLLNVHSQNCNTCIWHLCKSLNSKENLTILTNLITCRPGNKRAPFLVEENTFEITFASFLTIWKSLYF